LRFESSPGKQFPRLYEKNPSQKRLVEWLKLKALSSSPSTAKRKKGYIFIPVTREAEKGRLEFEANLGKKVRETLSQRTRHV
jgi:hypothetical protein